MEVGAHEVHVLKHVVVEPRQEPVQILLQHMEEQIVLAVLHKVVILEHVLLGNKVLLLSVVLAFLVAIV